VTELKDYLAQALDDYTDKVLDGGTIGDLESAVDMRLKHAQARYYNAVADAMEQPAQETEQDEAPDKYTEYIRKKKRYRETKTPESKQAMTASLRAFLADNYERLSEVYRDSDCQEEREQARSFAKHIHEVFP